MKKIFNKYIIIILSFYAIWMLGIPFIFSELLPEICENISLNSEYEVSVENPRLYLYPIPKATIKFEKVKVKAKVAQDYTNLENFETSIRLLPLLSGRVHINEIKIGDIKAASILKKELVLDKNFFQELQKLKIKLDELNIDSLALQVWQPNVKEPVLYRAEEIYFKRDMSSLKFKLASELKVKDTVSQANINLNLPHNNDVKKSIVEVNFDNFDISPLADYLKQYLPNDLVDINGIINIKVDKQNIHAVFENCSILMKDSAKSIIFPSRLELVSKFDISSKAITFDFVDVKSDNISASMNGKISNYLDKSKTMLNLNFQLNKSQVADIIGLLPPVITEDFNVYKLKHYKFFGDVIGNFSVKGDIYEPEVNGDVYINNGILIKPIPNAKGATIKLGFKGKYLHFDVDVPAGGLEKVWVNGGVELYNVKYADMHIRSTKQVDLATAEEKVVPIHEILNFIIGPVPIMDVKGDGNIDITVKGNRKNPHVWGVLNFDNVSTYFKEIPNLVLNNAAAVLTFNDQNAEFKTKKGVVNGKNISIIGNCNLFGKFDFDVESQNTDIGYLFNAIETSTMIDEVKKMLPKLEICKGDSNFKIKVYGSILDINNIQFNKNLFARGEIELLGNTFQLNGIAIDKSKGKIKFDSVNADADIQAKLGKSDITAKALLNNNIADVSVLIPNMNLNDIIPSDSQLDADMRADFCNIFADISAKYKGDIDDIDFNKIKVVAKILGVGERNKLKLSKGSVILNGNRLKASNLRGSIDNSESSFSIDIDADNVLTGPKVNGNIQLKAFDLSLLNLIMKHSIIPEELRNIKFESGKINLNCKINSNKVNAYTDLGGISLNYLPMELPIKIVNGSLIIRNNSLKLNKLNVLADEMPLLIDGGISDIFHKKSFDIYINSKPKQDFIDEYINKNQIYPVKIKGDIVYTLRLKGVKDNFDIKGIVNMVPDSSIYYLGATVGDIENAIKITLESKVVKNNNLKIKEFSYDKVISSLGNKTTEMNMLKAHGGIEIFKDNLVFKDLYIKTQNPTDARIFNIIFRKPNIKQGQFTSNLRINGSLNNPKVLGDFHIFETNIPFLETTMKNITFKFKDKTIDLFSKGEILGNDIVVQAVMKNKLTVPYYVEKANLNTKLLDLNYITEKIKLSEVDNYQSYNSLEGINLSALIIKNLSLSADTIHLRNITARDFEANASINEKHVFDVSNFKFLIANGILNGSYNYNLNNNNVNLVLKAKDIDANDLSYAVFDLKNQIYGDLTGDIKLSCSGENFENCMKTLNGKTTFNVNDGRIPKLGSLEYLLKAGNLIKGGLTSISINSVIDIITPLKTGNFSSIYGIINIKDGIANNIEISSKGKNLNLFITGTYNLSTADAEMEVLGMLSKKISTMFGPLGNLSLNTLFNAIPGIDLNKNSGLLENINKIPGIELSSKAYRKFVAEIKGNINGDDYVTSFKWIN